MSTEVGAKAPTEAVEEVSMAAVEEAPPPAPPPPAPVQPEAKKHVAEELPEAVPTLVRVRQEVLSHRVLDMCWDAFHEQMVAITTYPMRTNGELENVLLVTRLAGEGLYSTAPMAIPLTQSSRPPTGLITCHPASGSITLVSLFEQGHGVVAFGSPEELLSTTDRDISIHLLPEEAVTLTSFPDGDTVLGGRTDTQVAFYGVDAVWPLEVTAARGTNFYACAMPTPEMPRRVGLHHTDGTVLTFFNLARPDEASEEPAAGRIAPCGTRDLGAPAVGLRYFRVHATIPALLVIAAVPTPDRFNLTVVDPENAPLATWSLVNSPSQPPVDLENIVVATASNGALHVTFYQPHARRSALVVFALPWSYRLHRHLPAQFRAHTRAVLMLALRARDHGEAMWGDLPSELLEHVVDAMWDADMQQGNPFQSKMHNE